MNRQTIRFQPNEGVTVALEFQGGVHVQGRYGPQVRFSLTDNRVMYLDPDGAAAVRTLGVQAGEPFRITRRVEPGQKAYWDFERIRASGAILGNSVPVGVTEPPAAQPSPVSASPIPAKTAQPTPISSNSEPRKAPPVSSGLTRIPPQRASYGDAFVEILRCIRAGLNETGEQWSDQSVQAMASTMFIQAARDGKTEFRAERRVA